MKPVAIPPAVAASDDRSPVPSSLTGRLKTISARMSLSSSGGVLDSSSCGALAVPVMCTRASTPVSGISRVAVMSSIGLIVGVPVKRMRAVARQIELAALERVGAAHGVDRPDQRHRPARIFADAQVAADRDVQIAERRAGRPPGRMSLPRSTRLSGITTWTSRKGASRSAPRVGAAAASASSLLASSSAPGAAPTAQLVERPSFVAYSALPLPSTARSAETPRGTPPPRTGCRTTSRTRFDLDAGRIQPARPRPRAARGSPPVFLSARLHLHVAELVVEQLEVVGIDADVDRACLALHAPPARLRPGAFRHDDRAAGTPAAARPRAAARSRVVSPVNLPPAAGHFESHRFSRRRSPARGDPFPDPVRCTSASTVPDTLVSWLVTPCTAARLIALDLTCRSISSPGAGSTWAPVGLAWNSVVGTLPFAVIASVADCCSVASMPIRVPRSRPSPCSES